jgi:hypothetical protein
MGGGGGGGRRRRGRGRGRDDQSGGAMSRAARAPDHRRGDGRRTGPRRPGGKGDGHRFDEGRRRGPRDRDGHDRGRGRGEPRVFTVESSKPIDESRGHKGELRSLSGLRKLLGADGKESNTTDQRGQAAGNDDDK